jgi:hypothetical protein
MSYDSQQSNRLDGIAYLDRVQHQEDRIAQRFSQERGRLEVPGRHVGAAGARDHEWLDLHLSPPTLIEVESWLRTTDRRRASASERRQKLLTLMKQKPMWLTTDQVLGLDDQLYHDIGHPRQACGTDLCALYRYGLVLRSKAIPSERWLWTWA